MLQLLTDLDRVLHKDNRGSSGDGGAAAAGGGAAAAASGTAGDVEDGDGSVSSGSGGGSGLRGKAVVFSQHKSVIQHASVLLKAVGVRHVSICPGDNQTTLREAVATFNSDKSCGVFLLHAGTAAAGLTLTAARHVFLLEPFLSAAEEAQAMNRAHRIGQRHRASSFYLPLAPCLDALT